MPNPTPLDAGRALRAPGSAAPLSHPAALPHGRRRPLCGRILRPRS